MKTSLYRQEALDHLKSLDFGAPISLPRAQRNAATLAMFAMLGLVAWLFLGSYTRRVAVQGLLEPRSGLVHVRPSRLGRVVKVHVPAGSKVESGTPLFTLATDQETEKHGDNLSNRLEHLTSDKRRLDGDLATVKRTFEEQRRALHSEARAAQLRTKRLASRRSLHINKLKIKKDLVDRLTPLIERGYVSSIQFENAETELLQAKSDLELLSSQHDDAEQGEADVSSRIKRLSAELAEKSSAIASKISVVEQEISQVDADRALIINAPVSGEVTNILIAEGSGVSPSETLATIVPEGDRLVAKLLVNSNAIGFVKAGNPVTLRYRSFPYEKFGTHQARVSRIPGSAVAVSQDSGVIGSSKSGLAYRVDVELPSQSINVYGRHAPLSAGMEVTGDLMLDRRRLIEWIFEPLIGLRRRMDS